MEHEFRITYSYFDIRMLDRTAPLYNYIETDNSVRSLENDKMHHNSLQLSQYHILNLKNK